MRPLPEISEAKLTRRKTAARNYENVVKKDATFFKGLGRILYFLNGLLN